MNVFCMWGGQINLGGGQRIRQLLIELRFPKKDVLKP